MLGYPGAASFQASPAQIREVTEINGPDIYHATSVTRQVYVLIGSFPEAGSSGSAVVDLYGQVLGVYFGAETNDSTTGFAMTAAQVAPQMAKAGSDAGGRHRRLRLLTAASRRASSVEESNSLGGNTFSRSAAAVAGPTMPSTFRPGVRR